MNELKPLAFDDKSGNKIRLASATFELTNIPRLDVRFADGKGVVAPTYVP
jgi:hypothetical protein